MRIVVTGATGFIGRRLLTALTQDGHEVIALSRSARTGGGVRYVVWDGRTLGPWAAELDGADAVVHLAGDPIAQGRWTADKKRRIRQSRVESTAVVVQAIEQAKRRPQVMISGSAVGFYGPRGTERITEDALPGNDFLAGVCQAWEAAAQGVEGLGVRLVLIRTGVVLGRDGGVLAKMLPVFRLGLGGQLGSGKQGFPWIHVADQVGLIQWALTHDTVSGPLNAVAPAPLSNADFTWALNNALGRSGFLPVPALALRLTMGAQADLVLTGAYVYPQKALDLGYGFRFPTLAAALADLLSETATD